MRHLDDTTYAALAHGDPEASAYFAGHLGRPCDVCEAFLAAQEDATGAAADASLHPAQPGAVVDELGFRKVHRATGTRRRVVLMAAGALAAALLAVVVLPTLGAKPADEGIKTAGEPITIELSAVLQTSAGALRPVAPGANVPDDGTLLLRYRASAPGQATLRLERANGSEPLATFDVEPGLHDLEVRGESVGIALAGERGALRVVVEVATPTGATARAIIPVQVVPAR